MLISRNPVQTRGTGEKSVFFSLLAGRHQKYKYSYLFYDRSDKQTSPVWISVFHSSHSTSFIFHKKNTSNVYSNTGVWRHNKEYHGIF